MKRIFALLVIVLCTCGCRGGGADIEPYDMTCEYLCNPYGLDVAVPRFSWKLAATDAGKYGQRQTAYRLEVSTDRSFRNDEALKWDSDWIESSKAQLVEYGGEPVVSDEQYWWRVNVRDGHGAESGWSDASFWTSGLMSREDWNGAEWIGCGLLYDPSDAQECNIPDPWFRKKINLAGAPRKAFLHIASVGYNEVYVNGRKVSDDILSPVVSDHTVRARYVTYDIAPLLKKGENTVAVWLGTSWSVFEPYRQGDRPETPVFILSADIHCARENVRLVSDGTWLTHPSPGRLLGNWSMRNMGGELWDAGKEIPDWNLHSCDETGWQAATVYDLDLILSAQKSYPTEKFEQISPMAVERLNDGSFRFDMGVNFAGWIELQLRGEEGDRIDIEFSEREGERMTFSNHSAYIFGKNSKGTFRNRFNYGSGRWITVSGLSYVPEPDDMKAWTLRTAYPAETEFRCSDELHNWIYDRTLWTFRNLSIGGYIVDCPQRERLGYGGDAHATSETGMYNYDLAAFYTKWMEDWRDVQGRESNMGSRVGGGVLPHTAPTYNGGGGPAWGGIVVMLPWLMYGHYGDVRILEENWQMIVDWLDYLDSHCRNGILTRFGGMWDFLADWLWPDATAEGMNNDSPSAECFNSCYYALNLATASRIASVLGYADEAEVYMNACNRVREAVHEKYYDAADSSYCDGSMGNLAAALAGGVPPSGLRDAVMRRLETEITVRRNGHIHVGITGGALLFMLLRDEGRDDLLFEMTSKKDYPGWGYMRDNDATTIWEMWEKDLPGHSLLHSSFLFPGAWYIDGVAGIRRDFNHPGFTEFIAKVPDIEPLVSASASYDSPVGKIVSDWRKDADGLLHYSIEVPANSAATVLLPKRAGSVFEEKSGYAKYVGTDSVHIIYKVPAGRYEFNEM